MYNDLCDGRTIMLCRKCLIRSNTNSNLGQDRLQYTSPTSAPTVTGGWDQMLYQDQMLHTNICHIYDKNETNINVIYMSPSTTSALKVIEAKFSIRIKYCTFETNIWQRSLQDMSPTSALVVTGVEAKWSIRIKCTTPCLHTWAGGWCGGGGVLAL